MDNIAPHFARDRPPYVRFESRAIERRKTVEEGGEVFFVQEDFAIITPVGTKDIYEKPVKDWFKGQEALIKMQRWDPAWFQYYKAAYKEWLETNTVPLVGTPVANWPVLKSSEVKILTALHVMTVEDLVAANEETLGRIGMGARSLQQRARDWIAAKGGTDATLVQQLDGYRETNRTLEGRCAALEKQVQALMAVQTQAPVVDQLPSPRDRLVNTADADLDKTFENITL